MVNELAWPPRLLWAPLMTGTRAAIMDPTKTANTSPLTALKADLGLSASRLEASRDDPPRPALPRTRAACIVSHEPLITNPTSMRNKPAKMSGETVGLLSFKPLEASSRGTTNNGMPTSRGTSRQSLGAGGVTLG